MDNAKYEHSFTAFAICISLACLQYVKAWHVFQASYSQYARYFAFEGRGYTFELALLANVLVAGTLLYALDRYFGRSGAFSWAYRCGFLILFSIAIVRLLILPGVRQSTTAALGTRGFSVLFGVLLLTLLAISLRATPTLFRRARSVLLVLSPLLLVQIGTAAWIRWTESNVVLKSTNNSVNKSGKPSNSSRVIWIVFDEMDQRLAFENRPSRLLMPEFDRFRDQSLYATSAVPPATWTRESIPSLLTGRIVKTARPTAADDLRLQWESGSKAASLADQPTIVSVVRKMGLNSGVVGWYHPYCQVFKGALTSCASFPMWEYDLPARWKNYLDDMPLHRAFIAQLLKTTHVFYSGEGEHEFTRKEAARIFTTQKLKAKAVVADRNVHFVFLHFSVPHLPGIYDSVKQTVSTDGRATYVDNFALADRMLGEVRGELEKAGDWDRSTILVSSDHSLRRKYLMESGPSAADNKMLRATTGATIPFLLKLPFQKSGLEYHQPFNTAVSAHLLVAIMEGRVKSGEQVVSWLDTNREAGQVGLSALHAKTN